MSIGKTKECIICGRQFTSYRGTKTCGKKCKTEYVKQKQREYYSLKKANEPPKPPKAKKAPKPPKLIACKCATCGETFEVKRKRKYCGPKCRPSATIGDMKIKIENIKDNKEPGGMEVIERLEEMIREAQAKNQKDKSARATKDAMEKYTKKSHLNETVKEAHECEMSYGQYVARRYGTAKVDIKGIMKEIGEVNERNRSTVQDCKTDSKAGRREKRLVQRA